MAEVGHKKRKSDLDLNKDNADQVEDQLGAEGDDQEFTRATQAQIQQRRIVKVRRSAPIETDSSAKDKPANPFANFTFATTQQPEQKASEEQPVTQKEQAGKGQEVEEQLKNKEDVPEAQTPVKSTISEAKQTAQAGSWAFGSPTGGFAFKASTGGGFGALSSTPIAFGNTSTPTPANNATTPGSTDTPFSFGLSATKTDDNNSTNNVVSFGGNFKFDQVFQKSSQEGDQTDGKSQQQQAEAVAVLGPVQECKTGEEEEEVLFSSEGNLYQFTDNTWKQKGMGELKINKSLTGYSRFIFRSKGNLRVELNARIFPEINVQRKEGSRNSITFGCINFGEPSQFAFKMKDPSKVEIFMAVVDVCKADTGNANGNYDSMATKDNENKEETQNGNSEEKTTEK